MKKLLFLILSVAASSAFAATPTFTATRTATISATATRTVTKTRTPTPTNSSTVTKTTTRTPSATRTISATFTATPTPWATSTPRVTFIATPQYQALGTAKVLTDSNGNLISLPILPPASPSDANIVSDTSSSSSNRNAKLDTLITTNQSMLAKLNLGLGITYSDGTPLYIGQHAMASSLGVAIASDQVVTAQGAADNGQTFSGHKLMLIAGVNGASQIMPFNLDNGGSLMLGVNPGVIIGDVNLTGPTLASLTATVNTLTANVSWTAGGAGNTLIYTPTSGKRVKIWFANTSGAQSSLVKIKFGTGTASADNIATGYIAPGGGLVVPFAKNGPRGAVDASVYANVSVAGDYDCTITYTEE